MMQDTWGERGRGTQFCADRMVFVFLTQSELLANKNEGFGISLESVVC